VAALLELREIRKSFGAVEALKGVSFEIAKGEIVTLVGDNGAGKSTLIKIISGVFELSSGEVLLNGEPKTFKKPADAMEAGIETVYQHLALIEELDVADNVYLGRERTRGGFLGKVIGLLDRRHSANFISEFLRLR
jgi:ABC-type sugar transport system ATPase subunit